MAPDALPDISRQYGAQLEMKGDHNAALQCYDRALEDGRASLSEAAVARCEAWVRVRVRVRVGVGEGGFNQARSIAGERRGASLGEWLWESREAAED